MSEETKQKPKAKDKPKAQVEPAVTQDSKDVLDAMAQAQAAVAAAVQGMAIK